MNPATNGAKGELLMTPTTNVDIAHADIAETIKTHPVVLFMKGTPARPQCGFSATVVEVLRHYDNIPIHAIDVLVNPTIRQAIKTYSDWPSSPAVYQRRLCRRVRHREGNARNR
jgi:monothiol glutaredoxin